jgi:hypothetical protein
VTPSRRSRSGPRPAWAPREHRVIDPHRNAQTQRERKEDDKEAPGMRGLVAQRLLALFFGGTLLLNFPLLALWDRDATVNGLPLFPCALFAVWGRADRPHRPGSSSEARTAIEHARRASSSSRRVRLSAAAGRDRVRRRPARRARAFDHRQRLGLHAVAGGLLHRLDLLRQRRPRGHLGVWFLPIYLGTDARRWCWPGRWCAR